METGIILLVLVDLYRLFEYIRRILLIKGFFKGLFGKIFWLFLV